MLSLGQRTMGLVVDSVSEVLSVPTTELQAPPDFGAEVDAGEFGAYGASADLDADPRDDLVLGGFFAMTVLHTGECCCAN